MTRFPLLSVCAVLVVGLVWGTLAVPRSVSAASASAATDLELRSAPTFEAPVSLVVPAGAPLSLVGPPEAEFYPVTFEGTAGWVPASGLIVVKDEPAAIEPGLDVPPPTVAGPAEPSAPVVDPTAVPTEPTEPTEQTEALPTTTEPVAPTAMEEESPVPAVATAPVAPTEAVMEPTPTEAPPVSTAVPAVLAEPAPEPTGTAALTPAATAVPSPTASPTAVPTPTATPIPIVRGPATATVNAALLENPQRGSALLFSVPAGSTVTRTGSYVNGFVSADFMGITGWLDFDLLAEPLPSRPEEAALPEIAAATAVPSEAPVATAPPAPTAVPTATAIPTAAPEPTISVGVGGPGSGTAYASQALILRSGPSAAYPELATIPAGEGMALTGVMEGGFVRVEYGGQIGWVATSTLSLPVDPTPVTAPRGTASRRVFSQEEIIKVIYAAADRFDQPRADMLRVARCESGLDPYAVNASGSYGLFQFVASTWESTPYANKDVFDPKANANAAAWMWSVGRRNEWVCQ